MKQPLDSRRSCSNCSRIGLRSALESSGGDASFFAAGGLGLAVLPAKRRIGVAAPFVRCFENQLRHTHRMTFLVDGDKDQVGAGHMAMHVGSRVLSPDFYAHFHGTCEGSVDAGLESDQVAEVDGLDEIDMVHGGGDDVGA